MSPPSDENPGQNDGVLPIRPYRYSIELERGQRGGYGWHIQVRGDNTWQEVLTELDLIDRDLQLRFIHPSQRGPQAPEGREAIVAKAKEKAAPGGP